MSMPLLNCPRISARHSIKHTNLEDARSTIIPALGRMNVLYQAVVFDEWVLVRTGTEQGMILAYQGPRADSYKAKFLADINPLRTEIGQTQLQVGDFAFTHAADGTHFDACLRMGPTGYLFCNNTTKNMTEIRRSPLWLSAQRPFAELSAKFQADPLE